MLNSVVTSSTREDKSIVMYIGRISFQTLIYDNGILASSKILKNKNGILMK